MKLQVRRATEGDCDALERLVNLAYRSPAGFAQSWTGEGHLITGPRITPDEMLQKLRSRICVLLAMDGDTVVGCVEVEPPEESGGNAMVGMLSVDPHKQGGGIGRVLFDAAEQVAFEEMGASQIELWALRKRTELISWYLRRGFVDTGKRQAFPMEARVGKPTKEAVEAYEGDFSFAVLLKARP